MRTHVLLFIESSDVGPRSGPRVWTGSGASPRITRPLRRTSWSASSISRESFSRFSSRVLPFESAVRWHETTAHWCDCCDTKKWLNQDRVNELCASSSTSSSWSRCGRSSHFTRDTFTAGRRRAAMRLQLEAFINHNMSIIQSTTTNHHSQKDVTLYETVH